MGLLDGLPKNPKISDLVTVLEAVEGRLVDLEERFGELDHFAEQHAAGATTRQREVAMVRAETRKLRAAMRTGRKP